MADRRPRRTWWLVIHHGMLSIHRTESEAKADRAWRGLNVTELVRVIESPVGRGGAGKKKGAR